jgi:glycosyltransferase involved in cell wall biosynthesis
MKVTVVVRTCNRPEFLKEALASIELQSHTDWELLMFDDSASDINFSIYKWFKQRNSDKRVLYMSTKSSYDLFQNSWILAPELALGEIMIRLDDDDILLNDSLKFLVDVYTTNSELDFTYGSSIFFNDNKLTSLVETKNPFEHEKTRAMWAGYTIPNNSPWTNPWQFIDNYFETPQHYTSIIHAAKANQLSIYHSYSMRTSSVKRVKDKINLTSFFVDDLEFLGSLDYLGLGHNSIKKILCFVRTHNQGRVSDYNKEVNGQTMYQENFRIRDKVDYLRPSGFLSKIIPIQNSENYNNGICQDITNKFIDLNQKIHTIITD